MSRLVVVVLGHGHTVASMDIIKDELNNKFLELAPLDCTSDPIPIMTAGEDMG